MNCLRSKATRKTTNTMKIRGGKYEILELQDKFLCGHKLGNI